MELIVEIIKILFGIVCLWMVGLSIYKIIKEYKQYKTITQKVVFWIIVIACFFPIVIFYVDYYNVPTKLGWAKKMNVSIWLEIIMTYGVTIIVAIIGALVTIKSVQLSIDLQEERQLEEKKKEVLPLLKLEKGKENDYTYKYLQFDFLFTDESKNRKRKDIPNTANVTIKIKNIGMRELYDFYICNIQSTFFKENNEIHSMYPIVYKDDSVCINLYFYEMGSYDNDKRDDKYNTLISPITFDCYFKDCYENWYYQTLEISLFHQIKKNTSNNDRALEVSISDTKVISAPIEISEKDLPWKKVDNICFH